MLENDVETAVASLYDQSFQNPTETHGKQMIIAI